MVRLCLAVLLAGALYALPAHSQNAPSTKFYVSADVGTADNGVSEYAFGTPAGPRDEKSNLFRVRFGYQFVRFFALEAGYADLGSYSANIDMDCSSSSDRRSNASPISRAISTSAHGPSTPSASCPSASGSRCAPMSAWRCAGKNPIW